MKDEAKTREQLIKELFGLRQEIADLVASDQQRSQLEEEIALVDEVALIITSTLSIDEVYEKFAFEVKKLVDFDRMNINLIDYQRDINELKYIFGEDLPESQVGRIRPMEGSLTRRVADTHRTVVQPDIALIPRSPTGDLHLKMGLRSNAKIPLVSKGRVIGTLGVRSRRVGAYGPQEQAILERLASQIAPAVANIQVYEQVKEEMAVVDKIAQIITSTLHIDQVYEKFAHEMQRLVDFERMSVHIIDQDAGNSVIKYLFGEQPGSRVGVIRPLEGTQTQHVFTTGQPLTREDIATDDYKFVSDLVYLEAGLHSAIVLPLIYKSSVVGTMNLRSPRVRAYGEREQVILERLASQITPAIENARLYQETLQGQRTLRESEAKYRKLFEDSRDALYLRDLDGRFVDVNQALLDLFGYTRKEMVGMDVSVLCADPVGRKKFEQEMEQKGAVRDFETTFRKQDGAEVNSLVTATQWRARDGSVLGYQGMIHDITERKAAEEALTHSKIQLSAVLDTVGEGIITIDTTGTIVMLNQEIQNIWGYTHEEIIGKNLRSLMPKKYHEAHAAGLKRYLETGEAQILGKRLKLEGLKKDGSTFPLEIRITETRFEGTLLFTGAIRDITERKQAEEALRQSEDRFRRLVEGTADAFFVIDLDNKNRFVDVNQQACQSLGYSREQLLELSVPDIDIRFDAAKVQRVTQSASACGRPITVEGVHRRKDGTTFPVEVRVGLIDLDGGLHHFALVRDITQRKQSEERLRQAYAYLDSIMFNLPAGVAILDGPEFIYSKINHTLAEINGLPAEDHLGRPLSEVLPDASLDIVPRLREVLETGKPAPSHEFGSTLPGDPDKIRWFLDYFFPIEGPDGAPQAVGAVVLDITERKQMEMALREASEQIQEQADTLTQTNAELTKASQAKSEFLDHMSHELRTPLNAALGFARLLAEPAFGKLNVKQQRFLDNIITSGSHLLQLINDIIDISKIEAGKMELEVSPLDVRECLSSCYSIASGMAANKEITLNVKYPPRGTLILGDDSKIKQIVVNLLSNAVKFTPEGGKVYLKASTVGDELCISGIGISPQYQQRIFDQFDQGKPEIARHYGGSGLGLPLVKELVELHGGRLWLKSAEGKGSTFTVALPLTSARQPGGEESNDGANPRSR